MNDMPQKSDRTLLPADADFLVVGLVKNCATCLKTDVSRLKAALTKPKHLYWLLIELDSTDNTVTVLGEIAQQIDNFKFISLGTLRNRFSLRTERIAHCRNTYLNELNSNQLYRDIEYVVVSDFDGIITRITEDAISSCWDREGWDVCTANQRGPYYDIWALRHEDWCANDCWAQCRFLSKYSSNEDRLMFACVYSKMITVPFDSEWIEVDLAFGGLAIYRRRVIELGRYVGMNDKGEEICEHVLFHKQLKQKGCRIFINPRMINAEYTDHTEPLLMNKRLIRITKKSIKRSVEWLIGKDNFTILMSIVKSAAH